MWISQYLPSDTPSTPEWLSDLDRELEFVWTVFTLFVFVALNLYIFGTVPDQHVDPHRDMLVEMLVFTYMVVFGGGFVLLAWSRIESFYPSTLLRLQWIAKSGILFSVSFVLFCVVWHGD
jgi:hypothetical protein